MCAVLWNEASYFVVSRIFTLFIKYILRTKSDNMTVYFAYNLGALKNHTLISPLCWWDDRKH